MSKGSQGGRRDPMGRASRMSSTSVLRQKLGLKINVPLCDSTFLLVRYPLCTIASRVALRDSHSRQAESPRRSMTDSAFKGWVGQPVILQVALGDIKVPLRGKLLKDGDETVRMRIGDGWDVDIYKAMIVTVEEDSMALLPA